MSDKPTVAFNSVDRKDRVRKEYKNIDKLAASIAENGLIQPLILRGMELVAGGRRSMAIETLGITELQHGSCAGMPGKAGYVSVDELSDIDKLVMELEENFNREDLTWLESAQQIVRIHRLKTKQAIDENKSWGQRQTGALLGTSLGSVNNAVKVITAIEAGNQAVAKADSLTAALQVLLDQLEHEGLKWLAQTSKIPLPTDGSTIAVDLSKKPVGMAALKDDSNWVTSMPASHPSGSGIEQDASTPGGPIQTILDDIEIPLSKMLFHGDSVKDLMPGFGAESFDIIYTDIPYGTNPDNMEGLENFAEVRDEHQIIENVEMMPKFLAEAYRTLKTGGFCAFWYDLDHHEKLQKWAVAVGFKVQRWPLVWVKQHPCRNQAAQYNFTKTVETAMILRKGNAVLIKPQPRSDFACDGSIERKMYKNPFAKPFELHKWVLNAIAIQGMTVLDPCAGDGSIPRACVNLGFRPLAMEISDNHFPRLVENMKSVYQSVMHGKAKFV